MSLWFQIPLSSIFLNATHLLRSTPSRKPASVLASPLLASYGNKNEGALAVHGLQKDLQGPSPLSASHVS